jgi:hypothetical protein
MAIKNVIQYKCDACGKLCEGEPTNKLSWQEWDPMRYGYWVEEMHFCNECTFSIKQHIKVKVLLKNQPKTKVRLDNKPSIFSRFWAIFKL